MFHHCQAILKVFMNCHQEYAKQVGPEGAAAVCSQFSVETDQENPRKP